MAINKVVYGRNTLVDLTSDTVTPETLAIGQTAHNRAGNQIVGTMQGGGDNVEDKIINGTLSGIYENSKVTIVRSNMFYGCSQLTSVSFPICTNIEASAFRNCYNLQAAIIPACTSIGSYAFGNCSKLQSAIFPACTSIFTNALSGCKSLATASFPMCTNIGGHAFESCAKLVDTSFPACTYISTYAFQGCDSLATASFPKCTNILSYAFFRCYELVSLYLYASSVCVLSNSNAFSQTPIAGYSLIIKIPGSIFVPMSLLSKYKSATNWTYYSSRFVGK